MTDLSVPIPTALVSQILLRSLGRVDPVVLINNVLSDFLDRTYGDADIWSAEHAEEVAGEATLDHWREYGDPTKGVWWQQLFLPNGAKLRAMPYGRAVVAEVKRQQIVHKGSPVSPSRFASLAWNNTARNAWRDLEIQFPGEGDWKSAEALRQTPGVARNA